MHIILGATGNTGSALVQKLLERQQPVTAITHDPSKAEGLRRQGAQVRVTDIRHVDQLRAIFQEGKQLFLLNPPAPPSSDTEQEERETWKAIVAALEGSGLQKIVAQSTYGAQPGSGLGDLSVLYEMEQALAQQTIPTVIMRAAYLMSNWASTLQLAQEQGKVLTFFPENFRLPMVAPTDLAAFAAERLSEPAEQFEVFHVEGPERYTAHDVAQSLGNLMNKKLELQVVPREQWFATFQQAGFSEKAAHSYEQMTAATLQGEFPEEDQVIKGSTQLQEYFRRMLQVQSSFSSTA